MPIGLNHMDHCLLEQLNRSDCYWSDNAINSYFKSFFSTMAISIEQFLNSYDVRGPVHTLEANRCGYAKRCICDVHHFLLCLVST